MPYNKNYTNEIVPSRIVEENGNIKYQFCVKIEKFFEALYKSPNNIISYSIHLEGEDICLTGESWNDFNTMQHINVLS
jgi:hypothetical protein